MHYSEEPLSVKEVAELLETETTFVYKLVREGVLPPHRTNPISIARYNVLAYLNSRIPSKAVKLTWKNEPRQSFATA